MPKGKGKATRPSFDFFTKSKPTDSASQDTTLIKHVQFGSHTSQRLSSQTSYITAPASPKKRRLDDIDDAVDIIDEPLEAPSASSFLYDLQDPAYVYYLAEIALEEGPRKKTQSVSNMLVFSSNILTAI